MYVVAVVGNTYQSSRDYVLALKDETKKEIIALRQYTINSSGTMVSQFRH